MGRKRCAACNALFTPCRNVPDQQYCSNPACQRERRRRWQREKLKQDPDYRANQAAAQKRWRERNPAYWRNYRQAHPEYTAHNREKQRERNRRRGPAATGPSPPAIAKVDAYQYKKTVASGTYRLIPVTGQEIAKMDEYLVKMQVLSDGYTS
jgi:hypothetical protein